MKSAKAKFGMSSISCLGFVVSVDGVRPDPEKVDTIRNFVRPQTVKQLKGFLGLMNFYGTMVPKLQRVVKLLNRASAGEKNTRLEWTVPMELAFEEAKTLFADHVLTVLPDFTQPFIVTTDASEDGMGASLSQIGEDGTERPIAFYSKGIDHPESQKDLQDMVKTRELELYAFLAATRKWRSYLYGKQFVWQTDHKPLLWEERNPSKKVANWRSELREYDFDARYLRGEENTAADALSRQAARGRWPTARVLLTRTSRKPIPMLVPEMEVERVLKEWHDRRGHPGAQKTLDAVRGRFYWPGLAGDVIKWCASCDVC